MKKTFAFIFVVLILLCASGSAISLAWFTSSDYLRINSFDLAINASDELKVSLSKDDGYDDEIHESMAFGDYLIPVSSMMSSTWMNAKPHDPIFYGQADRNYNEFQEKNNVRYVVPKVNEATSGYYSQEFYLKTDAPKVAYLDTSDIQNTFIEPNIQNNEARADDLLAGGDSIEAKETIVSKLNNLVNSLRISILVDREDAYDYKIFDPTKDDDVLYGGVVDSDCKGMFDVKTYSDGSGTTNYEVMYGEVENREKIIYSYNNELSRKSGATWIDSGHYANTNTIDMDASIENGVNIAKEKSITFNENKTAIENLMNSQPVDSAKSLLIPLDTDIPTRIVISIYMEGWDKDNIDSTMGASFNAQLTFGILDRHII